MLNLLLYFITKPMVIQKEKNKMAKPVHTPKDYITNGNVCHFVHFDRFRYEVQSHVALLREQHFIEVNWFYTMGMEDFSNHIPLAFGLNAIKSFEAKMYETDIDEYMDGWKNALGWYYMWLLLSHRISEEDVPTWAEECYNKVLRQE